jgi:hypothetical protein
VQFFYQGLSQPNRSMIKSMNNGGFLSLTGDHAYKALDKIANNSQQWDFSSYCDKSTQITKKGGIYELSREAEMKLKIDAITKRLDTLDVSRPISAANTFTVESCSICASSMHQEHNCPSMAVFFEMEQGNAFNDYRKQSNGPYSKTYNPGWRNHLNFSWK